MKHLRCTLGIAVCPMVFLGFVWGQSSASGAAAGVDADSPSAFMLSYDQLAGADPEAYLPLYSVSGSDDRKLAAAEAKFDAEVGMLQKMVQQLWGNDAVNQTIHALGMQTADDIHAAAVTENGDHATVTYADGSAGPMLVKTPAGWRLDTTAFRKALGMPVKDYIKQLHQMSAMVAEVADGIDQKRLRSADAVAHEIAVKMAAIH